MRLQRSPPPPASPTVPARASTLRTEVAHVEIRGVGVIALVVGVREEITVDAGVERARGCARHCAAAAPAQKKGSPSGCGADAS